MSNQLDGKVALVTGGGRGIGRAIARCLAAHGAAVLVNDLGSAVDGAGADPSAADSTAAEIEQAGGRALADYSDVRDFAACEAMVDRAVAELGSLDILVNNAGILRDHMIFNVPQEEFDSVVAVHLKGTFNCTRHAAGRMRRQRSGRIVNITSTSGLYGNSGQASYAAAKDGVVGLTRVVSRELGKYSITVNAVAPAAVTRMAEEYAAGDAAPRQPPGVIGSPAGALSSFDADDVAPFVTYLATDAASGINGQTFAVWGGVVSLLNDPAPARTLTKPTRWRAEEIAALFPSTFALDLINPAPPRES